MSILRAPRDPNVTRFATAPTARKWTMRHCGFFVLAMLAILSLCVASNVCLAIGGTDKIAAAGVPVEALEGWPKGVAEFLNRPSRTEGSHRWFSEHPNDTRSYKFRVDSEQELQQLIQQFAKIESDRLAMVFVTPEEGKTHPTLGASFVLGNQTEIDRWYAHLKVNDLGQKVFGVHRYDRAPEAMPPTLWVFLKTSVDADRLEIPANISIKKRVVKPGQPSMTVSAE